MNTGEILIYQNQEGNVKIDVRLEEEKVWQSKVDYFNSVVKESLIAQIKKKAMCKKCTLQIQTNQLSFTTSM